MEKSQHLRISSGDIFEAYGKLVTSEDCPSKLVPDTLPRTILLDSTVPSTFVSSTKWDRKDALSQLRRALCIDTPPRLVQQPLTPHVPAAAKEDLRPLEHIPHPMGDAIRKTEPSMQGFRLLQEIHSECTALSDWLGRVQSDTAGPRISSECYTHLINNEGVALLHARARRVLKHAREWDELRRLLAQASVHKCLFGSSKTDQLIEDVTKFRASVADTKKAADVFFKFLDRLYVIASVLETALDRCRVYDELEEATSAKFRTTLEELLSGMGNFETALKQNKLLLLRNTDALTKRIANINERISRLEERKKKKLGI